jgi:hypothetical protein
MQPQATFAISIVLKYEEYGWAAQCLEYDIAAQGRTIGEAKTAFEKAFIGQIIVDISHGIAPLSQILAAPQHYWQMFDKSEKLMGRKSYYIPPPYMVRATAEDVRICA